MTERDIPDTMVRAEYNYLPKLPDVQKLLCISADSPQIMAVKKGLVEMFFEQTDTSLL
jgi:hypothetical protein